MITIHFDGSCAPTNPGFTGGIGAVIKFNGLKRTISKQVKSSYINASQKQKKFVEKIVTCERRVRKLDKEYQAVCA